MAGAGSSWCDGAQRSGTVAHGGDRQPAHPVGRGKLRQDHRVASGKAQRSVSLRVVQTPESLADIALQADYYAGKESIALAQRFTDAVKITVRLMADNPLVGKATGYTHPKLAGIRL